MSASLITNAADLSWDQFASGAGVFPLLVLEQLPQIRSSALLFRPPLAMEVTNACCCEDFNMFSKQTHFQ